MKAHLATAACAAILSLQLPIASNADGLAFAQAGLRRCGGDIARLCDDVFPGGGRIAQCLIDQFERLSPPCRSHVAKGKLAKTIVFACEADAARVCPDVRPGEGACQQASGTLVATLSLSTRRNTFHAGRSLHALLLGVFRFLGFFFLVLDCLVARGQFSISACFQINIDAVDVAHDVGVVGVGGHCLLAGRLAV